MGSPAKIRIATHVEVTWLDAEETSNANCPNCLYQGPARQFLDIDYRPPDAVHHFILQICPHCSVRFTDNPETMDYATEQLIEIGWHVYQTQIGAGVWPIAAPLTRIAKPAGARVLEIGGAYGFGLDFGIRARGWTGEGFDPSPLAEYGARELGLNIVKDYFTENHLSRGPYDVVIATEVIEHLAHPPSFLTLMRRALADDGILVLSTPDAAWITPALDGAQLMTLLSPGAHVVLQTADSLRTALQGAGFTHIIVERSTTTLVAYASSSPFTLDDDPASGRALYRGYLVARSKISAPGSDLQLGFAGRGLFEAANDADPEAASVAWATLLPAVQSRFRLDLETLDALPAATATASLAELAGLIPLGLGMIMFGRANLLSAQHVPRATLEQKFHLAAAAAAALQNALAQRSLTDGLSANIINAAAGEIALCHAEAGDAGAVPTLVEWSRCNASTTMPWRGFTGLVNANAIQAAQSLHREMQLDWPAADLPPDLRRDALLSLANLALSPVGDTLRAFDYAAELRAMDEPADKPNEIALETFTRLVNAGNFAAADDALRDHDIGQLAQHVSGEAAEDARQALILLDLGQGRTTQAVARLTPLLPPPSGNSTLDQLCTDCFVRLVNESRFAEASALALHDVEARFAACPPPLHQDALAAALLLELQPGGSPAAIVRRVRQLAAEKLDEDRLADLQSAAFVTLVNQDEIVSAVELYPVMIPLIAKLRAPFPPASRNALFAYGVFATSANNQARDPTRGAATFAKLRDDLAKTNPPGAAPNELFWPCLRGEVAALNELKRGEEANALLRDFLIRFPGAPDDLRALIQHA